MFDIIIEIKDIFLSLLREEWFWAIVTVAITLLSFIIQLRQENEISRASFVYNLSNDFGNNERILRVYQWLEKCRRENLHSSSIRCVRLTAEENEATDNKSPIDFIDIDTYVNHFEVVYVILRSVTIKNIDELFQQRFLSFMFNPYVQKEVLFTCFGSNENNFRLLKKWLTSIYMRNHFSCRAFVSYLTFFMCGDYELTTNVLDSTKKLWPLLHPIKVKNYLLNYVNYICDPACQYGYYEFSQPSNQEKKALRIIRSAPHDADAIIALQKLVVSSMEYPEWYASSTDDDIIDALNKPQDYACLQVCDGNRIIAFAYVILNPTPEQDLNLNLKAENLPYAKKAQCILETVFVDPDYRGFGIQNLLIRVLCNWSATLGKRSITATVHPNNSFSSANFRDNGFHLVTPTPLKKYDGTRYFVAKKLSHKELRKSPDGNYCIYPYV